MMTSSVSRGARVTGRRLLVTLTLTLTLLVRPSQSSKGGTCSFVRSHNGEQCVYNIHVSPDSGSCRKSGRDRRHFETSGDHDATQSDYAEKIVNMEKTFSYMKDDHDKRLKDLEGTIKGLVAGGDPNYGAVFRGRSPSDPAPPSSSSSSRGSHYSSRSRRVDSSMLSRLQREFQKLRTALKKKTEQLLDVQYRVNETDRMLEKSQVDVFAVSQQLLDAENRIAVLERERAVLKNQVKDGAYKLGVSSERVLDCERKLGEQEDQLLTLIRKENTLSEDLMTCQLRLNMSNEELVTVQTRHKELKTRLGHVKNVLKIRENELIDCYNAKTQSFCGFEDPNICGFTQPNDTSDFFDWFRGEGKTPSVNTGPSADHTCGTTQGHFMYIEASAKGRGMNAIIYSPLYRGLKQQCLEFYYHMNGRHIGTLNVYAKARGAELASVWRAYGNQGDLWSVARLAIPKDLARAGYQIAFEGITEKGYQGDMAIDDVSVTDGPCPMHEGVQTVQVQFNANNSSALIRNAKKFARNMKKMRLSKVRRKKKSKRAADDGRDSGDDAGNDDGEN